jgi:RNA polymerase sigma-70 factor (ECF subfamily)
MSARPARLPISIEPEAELVVRARRYEADALAELFDRHYPALFRYAFARLGDSQAAEEAAGAGLNRALAALTGYQDRGPGLLAWLYRQVHLAITDQQRQGVRPTAGDPLRTALATLTPDQQEVLTLRFVTGLSPADIAAVSGRRTGAVVALQHRGLEALRRALEPAPEAPKETNA